MSFSSKGDPGSKPDIVIIGSGVGGSAVALKLA